MSNIATRIDHDQVRIHSTFDDVNIHLKSKFHLLIRAPEKKFIFH